jgi:hypothetical protein
MTNFDQFYLAGKCYLRSIKPSHYPMVYCLVLRVQEGHAGANLLQYLHAIPEVHCETQRINTSPTDPPNEPAPRL